MTSPLSAQLFENVFFFFNPLHLNWIRLRGKRGDWLNGSMIKKNNTPLDSGTSTVWQQGQLKGQRHMTGWIKAELNWSACVFVGNGSHLVRPCHPRDHTRKSTATHVIYLLVGTGPPFFWKQSTNEIRLLVSPVSSLWADDSPTAEDAIAGRIVSFLWGTPGERSPWRNLEERKK